MQSSITEKARILIYRPTRVSCGRSTGIALTYDIVFIISESENETSSVKTSLSGNFVVYRWHCYSMDGLILLDVRTIKHSDSD
jgi:hypothetical protein